MQGQILDLLEKEKPDIVCFQEAVTLDGLNGGFFGAVEEIIEKTDLKQHYFSPVFGIQIMRRKADFGNCILTKFPIMHTETVFTRKEYVEDFDFNEDDYNIRNLQHVTLDVDGEPLHVLNHHGHHIHQHKNGDDETLRQCEMIAQYVGSLEGKVILTGDFNLAPHSESLEKINKVLNNACIEYGVQTTRTPLTKKTEVCDFIFTSPEVAVKGFEVLPDLASDHCALLLEFQ